MKIVVFGNSGDAWWEIRDDSNKPIATSFVTYSRKSDAKRGAGRFEQKLFELYYNELVCSDSLGGIPIEVIK